MRIRRRSAAPAEPGELNLVPIMNLIVCLVPMVLLGMAVVKVGVINANAPRIGPPCTENCDEAPPLHLRVHIGEAGIELKSGLGANEAEPKRFERGDLVGVYQTAVALKASHPEETIANISADARIPYRDVVALIDVLRHELDGEVGDRTDLAQLMPRHDEGRPALLFPDVVFLAAN